MPNDAVLNRFSVDAAVRRLRARSVRTGVRVVRAQLASRCGADGRFGRVIGCVFAWVAVALLA
eukprot:8623785-Lingulodinium_polyedra.AAC.1